MNSGLHKSSTWLVKRRLSQGKTVEEMAKEAGVTTMTIRRALEKAGLK